MKIMFVCTGNTCRSPMAKALAEQIFQKAGVAAEVDSAGLSAMEGANASQHAITVMDEFGCDIRNHRAKHLSEGDASAADLILTMGEGHKNLCKSLFPEQAHKVYTLREYTKEAGGDISDPYGQDEAVYRQCASDLQSAIEKLADMLTTDKPIALGCDQAGFDLMQEVMKHLSAKGLAYRSFGTDSTDPVDYPVFAKRVAHAILDGACQKGILICGTGIGISITANRFPGIRAALCHDVFSAKATRLHNDANILAMGGRVIGPGAALEVVDAFLETEFSGAERHIKRIGLIELD